jgi:hypothetical protein
MISKECFIKAIKKIEDFRQSQVSDEIEKKKSGSVENSY